MHSETDLIDLTTISEGLRIIDGIWYPLKTSDISYPDDGNDECYKFEERSYWFKIRNKVLLTVINKYSSGNKFFDIGGGNGFVTKSLCDSGYDVYLVEPGKKGISNAKDRGVKNLVNSSFQEALFKDNTLNNVGLFDVLEHIEFDGDFVEKLSKNIKENGMVFITVPAYSFLWSDSDLLAGHYRRYSLKSIAELLKNFGFSIIYKTHFISFLVPIIFIFRSIPFRLKKKKSRNNKIEDKDYSITSKSVNFVIDRISDIEVKRIKEEKKICFGSSCLIVARKNEIHSIQ